MALLWDLGSGVFWPDLAVFSPPLILAVSESAFWLPLNPPKRGGLIPSHAGLSFFKGLAFAIQKTSLLHRGANPKRRPQDLAPSCSKRWENFLVFQLAGRLQLPAPILDGLRLLKIPCKTQTWAVLRAPGKSLRLNGNAKGLRGWLEATRKHISSSDSFPVNTNKGC